MSFMVPVIEEGEWLEVETNSHSELIHPDVYDRKNLPDATLALLRERGEITGDDIPDSVAREIREYCEGSKIRSITLADGYFARMSAPGYLDATEWMGPYDSLKEAQQELAETYDLCSDCLKSEEECECNNDEN